MVAGGYSASDVKKCVSHYVEINVLMLDEDGERLTLIVE